MSFNLLTDDMGVDRIFCVNFYVTLDNFFFLLGNVFVIDKRKTYAVFIF